MHTDTMGMTHGMTHQDAGHLEALHDLMATNGVSEAQIREEVSERGYFPRDLPIDKYPAGFVREILIAAWPQVLSSIRAQERWARAWDASCDLTDALNAVIHLEGINPDSDEARYHQRWEELMRAGRIYRDAVEHSETAEETDRRFMAGMADAGLCSRAMHPDYTDEEHEAYMEEVADMVTYELKEMTETRVVYTYHPEGREGHAGEVGLDLATGERVIIDVSDDDPAHRYAFHALSGIEKFAKDGEFRSFGESIWY